MKEKIKSIAKWCVEHDVTVPWISAMIGIFIALTLIFYLWFMSILPGGKNTNVIESYGMEPMASAETIEVEPEVATTPEPEPILYFDVPLSVDLQDHIFTECEKYGLDPALIIAMIKTESTYNPSAVSSGGAYGLMQIIPRWHKGRMQKLGCSNLLDPYQNTTVGINYIAELIGYGRSVEWALMAYNGGISYANGNYSQGVVSSYARTILADSKSLIRVKEN